MKKRNLIFAAVLCMALAFGFSACENPNNDDLLNQIEDLKNENELNDLKNDKDKTDSADKDSDKDNSSDSPVSNFTPAAFSVSSTQQVYFSPANLQYIRSSDTWQFASCQWECVGTDNVTGGEVTSNEEGYFRYHGTALADKVDLFGWSTPANNFGVSTSENENDYNGSFVDWGVNKIGNDAPNTWRTLTEDEWYYLLNGRANESSLKGVAQVNGVNGLILLPDNWECPVGITFQSGYHSDYGVDYYSAYQTFTADQWSKMESAGAVFLPAAGSRYGSEVYYVQYLGCYWVDTVSSSDDVDYIGFGSGAANVDGDYLHIGVSVRLVKDL